jgi:hypothetical protein
MVGTNIFENNMVPPLYGDCVTHDFYCVKKLRGSIGTEKLLHNQQIIKGFVAGGHGLQVTGYWLLVTT